MDTRNILIVDDDADLGNVLADIFKEENFNAKVVYDEKSALKEIRQAEYDFMIVDYRVGTDNGLSILEKAKNLKKNIQAVMISAHGNQEVKNKALSLGAKGFFDKPFDIDTLVNQVNHILTFGEGTSSDGINRRFLRGQ